MEKRYDYITPKDYIAAESNGINTRALEQRVRDYGWDVERAITQPMRKSSSFGPVWDKWKETATKNGVSRTRFYHRIKNDGWPEEKSATVPVGKAGYASRWTDAEIELATKNGLAANGMNVVNIRISKLGWSKEKALNTPKMMEAERVKRVGEGTRAYHERRKKDGFIKTV